MILPLVFVGVTIALALLIAITHRGRGDRTKLLKLAVIALLTAAALRELSVVLGDIPELDLVKRAVLLVAEMAAILLVLTFRNHSITRTTAMRLWILTAAVAVLQMVLVLSVPLTPERMLPPYSTVVGNIPAMTYFAINHVGLLVFAIVGGVGCIKALRGPAQPPTARFSMIMLLVAGAAIVGYASSGILMLVGVDVPYDAIIQRVLLITTITFFLIALIAGGVRKIVSGGRENLIVTATTDIVEPLWQVAVKLHPDVILPMRGLTAEERLIRLVVETHDAISLITRDNDKALDIVRDQYIPGPRRTAGLIMHLLGEGVVPESLRRTTKIFMSVARRVPTLRSSVLIASVAELYDIRRALATRDQWWVTPAIV